MDNAQMPHICWCCLNHVNVHEQNFYTKPHPRFRGPSFKMKDALKIIIVLFLLLITCVQTQRTCKQPGRNEVIKWHTTPRNYSIEWRIDTVCSTYRECYGFLPNGDTVSPVQLCPVEIQLGDFIQLIAPPSGNPYTMKPVNVTSNEWLTCPVKQYSSSQMLFHNTSASNANIQVPQQFLITGTRYLAQLPNGAFSNCNFGLRVKISIKGEDCKFEGEKNCSSHGVCGSKILEDQYRCYCDSPYRGRYCQEYDACQPNPCDNGGHCSDTMEGLDGSNYTCICQGAFTGKNCSEVRGICASQNPSCNNGTCVQLTATSYTCNCSQGYTGPFCQDLVKTCTPGLCQNGATCVDVFQNYVCRCPVGFTGRNCETNIDECASSPCPSGATCQDGINNFRCVCPAGYSGRLCNEMINFCLSDPCEGRGKCQPLLNGFHCNCSVGFQGDRCQEVVGRCSDAVDLCKNGGHCLQSPDGPVQCQCSPGWTGPTCEQIDNLCLYKPCKNGSTCVDTSRPQGPGTYTCVCPPGLTGRNCEADIDECASNPCQNGGVCTQSLAYYNCTCPLGYKGTNCEVNVDACAGKNSLLCLNGASCVDGNVGLDYHCLCAPGFTGGNCSVELDECVSEPCQNNGSCVDRVNGYVCNCSSGFYGRNCESPQDNCLHYACQNGATCVTVLGGYRCLCAAGWNGTNCTVNVDECRSQPCQNGANCTDMVDSYSCNCALGFSGRNCETNLNECASSPCHNGTCVDDINSYTCICPNDTRKYDTNCNVVQPCASDPCQNNASCIGYIDENRFICKCMLGYKGRLCEEEINECLTHNVTCLNGGTCVDQIANFTCACPVGFTGRFCEIDIDYCRINTCANNSTCRDGLANYTCECKPGYVGRFCEQLPTKCSQSPCVNGATCQETGQNFTCVCPSGLGGRYCERELNECASNPCENNGTCLDKMNSFQCQCRLGFTGVRCEKNINNCVNHTCQNNATCVDGMNTYSCQCVSGFNGTRCETNIDDCQPGICNNGVCVDLVNSFECFCKNGFTGPRCDINYNECLSQPCQNAGNCTDFVAAFNCTCPPGFTGLTCETDINECASSPCQHGATCQDQINSYRCMCLPGYTGAVCEKDIDECASQPCQRQGTCRDHINAYLCDCVQPYKGVNCNLLPCDLEPCGPSANCTNDLAKLPDGFVCQCPEGLTGKRCQSNVNDCVRKDGKPACSGRGHCLDGLNSYQCLCQPGWKGKDCERPLNECYNHECKNGATCVNTPTGYRCNCVPGYAGQFCERQRDECKPNPCANGAQCVDLFNDYRCICPAGWTGKNCSEEVNECKVNSTNPCLNKGRCVDAFNNFTCICAPFYTGRFCETLFDPCGPTYNQCRNNASCSTSNDGTYHCSCPPGFNGTNCEVNINECASSPCQNGARCEDGMADYMCHCLPGYSGKQCQIDIDDCQHDFCQHNSTCEDMVNGYVCNCTRGWTGRNCSEDINECGNSPCVNNGTCTNLRPLYHCNCLPGYAGIHCEININECASSPCSNGGTCRDRINGYMCECVTGFTGRHCEVNINECQSDPCQHGNCTDLVNGYSCDCVPGWSGKDCSLNINECASNPCRNGGRCRDLVNQYVCHCAHGYTGPHCEIDIDVCSNGTFTQCQNGGTCLEGLGPSFSCRCAAGFTGSRCETNIDECGSNPCRNSAVCVDGINTFSCTCLSGWTGVQCETDIDECSSNPCLNEGICQQRAPGQGFECLCKSGWGGTRCEINYDDCLPAPRCFNGGRCIDATNNYTCECPPWATGRFCESLLYTPTPSFITTSTPVPEVSSTRLPSLVESPDFSSTSLLSVIETSPTVTTFMSILPTDGQSGVLSLRSTVPATDELVRFSSIAPTRTDHEAVLSATITPQTDIIPSLSPGLEMLSTVVTDMVPSSLESSSEMSRASEVIETMEQSLSSEMLTAPTANFVTASEMISASVLQTTKMEPSSIGLLGTSIFPTLLPTPGYSAVESTVPIRPSPVASSPAESLTSVTIATSVPASVPLDKTSVMSPVTSMGMTSAVDSLLDSSVYGVKTIASGTPLSVVVDSATVTRDVPLELTSGLTLTPLLPSVMTSKSKPFSSTEITRSLGSAIQTDLFSIDVQSASPVDSASIAVTMATTSPQLTFIESDRVTVEPTKLIGPSISSIVDLPELTSLWTSDFLVTALSEATGITVPSGVGTGIQTASSEPSETLVPAGASTGIRTVTSELFRTLVPSSDGIGIQTATSEPAGTLVPSSVGTGIQTESLGFGTATIPTQDLSIDVKTILLPSSEAVAPTSDLVKTSPSTFQILSSSDVILSAVMTSSYPDKFRTSDYPGTEQPSLSVDLSMIGTESVDIAQSTMSRRDSERSTSLGVMSTGVTSILSGQLTSKLVTTEFVSRSDSSPTFTTEGTSLYTIEASRVSSLESVVGFTSAHTLLSSVFSMITSGVGSLAEGSSLFPTETFLTRESKDLPETAGLVTKLSSDLTLLTAPYASLETTSLTEVITELPSGMSQMSRTLSLSTPAELSQEPSAISSIVMSSVISTERSEILLASHTRSPSLAVTDLSLVTQTSVWPSLISADSSLVMSLISHTLSSFFVTSVEASPEISPTIVPASSPEMSLISQTFLLSSVMPSELSPEMSLSSQTLSPSMIVTDFSPGMSVVSQTMGSLSTVPTELSLISHTLSLIVPLESPGTSLMSRTYLSPSEVQQISTEVRSPKATESKAYLSTEASELSSVMIGSLHASPSISLGTVSTSVHETLFSFSDVRKSDTVHVPVTSVMISQSGIPAEMTSMIPVTSSPQVESSRSIAETSLGHAGEENGTTLITAPSATSQIPVTATMTVPVFSETLTSAIYIVTSELPDLESSSVSTISSKTTVHVTTELPSSLTRPSDSIYFVDQTSGMSAMSFVTPLIVSSADEYFSEGISSFITELSATKFPVLTATMLWSSESSNLLFPSVTSSIPTESLDLLTSEIFDTSEMFSSKFESMYSEIKSVSSFSFGATEVYSEKSESLFMESAMISDVSSDLYVTTAGSYLSDSELSKFTGQTFSVSLEETTSIDQSALTVSQIQPLPSVSATMTSEMFSSKFESMYSESKSVSSFSFGATEVYSEKSESLFVESAMISDVSSDLYVTTAGSYSSELPKFTDQTFSVSLEETTSIDLSALTVSQIQPLPSVSATMILETDMSSKVDASMTLLPSDRHFSTFAISEPYWLSSTVSAMTELSLSIGPASISATTESETVIPQTSLELPVTSEVSSIDAAPITATQIPVTTMNLTFRPQTDVSVSTVSSEVDVIPIASTDFWVTTELSEFKSLLIESTGIPGTTALKGTVITPTVASFSMFAYTSLTVTQQLSTWATLEESTTLQATTISALPVTTIPLNLNASSPDSVLWITATEDAVFSATALPVNLTASFSDFAETATATGKIPITTEPLILTASLPDSYIQISATSNVGIIVASLPVNETLVQKDTTITPAASETLILVTSSLLGSTAAPENASTILPPTRVTEMPVTTTVLNSTSRFSVLPSPTVSVTPSLTTSFPTTPSLSTSFPTTPTTTAPVPTRPPSSCLEAPCMNGGTCRNLTAVNQTYECICNFKYTGRRCEIARNIMFPQYNGQAYLQFVPPDLNSSIVISLTLKTTQESGMIFYSARDYSVKDRGHYVRLVVDQGILKYQFSCVLERFDLHSSFKVNTGELFNVTIIQTRKCRATLEVQGSGNYSRVELGMSFVFESFEMTQLAELYVGGLPLNTTSIPTVVTNLTGCVGNMAINGQEYQFMNAVKGQNVQECGFVEPTTPAPPTPLPSPLPTCDDIICQNGGTCKNVLTPDGRMKYQCNCKLHFKGPRCEEEITVYFPSFNGDSYLEHPPMNLISRTISDIYITFKTSSNNGTILYSASTDGQFIHLFIEGTVLKYQLSCGGISVLAIDTNVTVNTNNLTAVSIRQSNPAQTGSCGVSVRVNSNRPVNSTLITSPSPAPARLGPLYLGGLPPGVTSSPRSDPVKSFVGCMRHLQINSNERQVFGDAVRGQNIEDCNVPACTYKPCVNNGTCLLDGESWFCQCPPGYSGSLCERTLCDRNPCRHGGTCIHLKPQASYVCLCPYGRHGVNCTEALSVKRPSFSGLQYGYSSFISYARIQNPNFALDIKFKFTVDNTTSALQSSLLIYTGQKGSKPSHGSDFVAVGILKGFLVFRFDLGSGLADIRSAEPINMSLSVHTVQLGRNKQSGWLKLDNQANVTGTSRGQLVGLNVFSVLYVGGLDVFRLDLLPKGARFTNGFQGCLFDLEVRTGRFDTWKAPGSPAGQVESGRNVQECRETECQLSQCHNGGECVDLGASYRCNCTGGWKGALCADRLTACDGSHDCSPGSKCVPKAGGGFECRCALGRTGAKCNQNLRIGDPEFVGESSYMAFPALRNARFGVNIQIQFRPKTLTGLLLYVAEHLNERSGDFMSVTLQNGSIELRFNLGTDPTTVVTSKNVVSNTTGTWHTVQIGRNNTHGYVRLDGIESATLSTAGTISMDVTTSLYLGGVPDLSDLAPTAIQDEPSAFEGCVRKLTVNGRNMELNERGAVSGLNVVNCDGSICGHNTCKNGGQCSSVSNTAFKCTCTKDYYGETCNTSVLCLNNQCASGATCVPNLTTRNYSCACPLGSKGMHCKQAVNFTSARFDRDSYIFFREANYSSTNRSLTYLAVNFSTTATSGLLLWNGQVLSDKDDYLGLGLVGGRLRLVWSLGWWTRQEIITTETVSDGRWHAVTIDRVGQKVTLSIDGQQYQESSSGSFQGLDTEGIYHLGGFELGTSVKEQTNNHFQQSFQGCIKDVQTWSGAGIDLQQSQRGMNIDTCDAR